jgi:O-antigen/teichoic acid export membrane protein
MVLLARELGPTGRGLVATTTAPLLLLVALLSGGVPDAVTHYVARMPEHRRTVMLRGTTLILSGAVAGIIAIFLSAGSLSGNHDEIRAEMSILSLSIIPASCVFLLRAQASAFLKWRRVSAEMFISSSIRILAISLLAAIDDLTVTTGSIVLALGVFVGAFAYLPLGGMGKGQEHTPGRSDAPTLGRLAHYSGASWLGVASASALSYFDQLTLTPLSSAYESGIYAVAISVSNLVGLLSSSVRQVVLATESSGVQLERIAATARITLLLNLVIAIAVCGSAPWLIPLVFGTEFREAIVPTVLLVIPLVAISSGSIASAGLMALGRPGARSMAVMIGAVLNAILVLILVPRYGALGAALAMLANITPSWICIRLMKRDYGVPTREFLILRRADLRIISDAVHGFARH